MFSNLEKLTIPEGEVVKITAGGVTLWERTGSLPSAYQRVEWVRAGSAVGAYINLGFAFDTAARYKIGFYAQDTNKNTGYLYGAAENSGALRCMITAPNGAYEASVYGSNNAQFNSMTVPLANGLNEFECILREGLRKTINLTTGKSYQDGSQAAYTMTNELYLLAQNYNGSPRFVGSGITRP